MKKINAALILLLAVLFVTIPYFYDKSKVRQGRKLEYVRLYNHADGKIYKLPLEEYLVGVVAAEMPAAFPLDALKAQAVAARTYIVKRLSVGVENPAHPGADICDDCRHGQAWVSREELKERWGAIEYYKYYYKVKKAVDETAGQVITYKGELVDPVYHSSCGGRGTENSGDVWQVNLPYLRAVPCPYCADPEPVRRVSFTLADVGRALGADPAGRPGGVSRAVSDTARDIGVIEKTSTGRPKTVRAGESVVPAVTVRERLGLRSTDFTVQVEGGGITFTTTGYGHAVGMCQYGAKGMAEHGYGCRTIIGHYYSGAEITNMKILTPP
ncbi:MAG: stage II sporulation protein D [Eubacteriales bacterium]|nr:stage II sporulation protein D [Bacillota bacterium]